MIFDRSGQWLGSTWTYRRFRVHQTEINQLYWSFAPAAGYSKYAAQHAATSATATVFHASGPDVHRIPQQIGEWQKSFGNFSNWVRLGSALSAASYLELFIRSVITTALTADPLCRFGKPLVMDGVTWLKHGLSDDIDRIVRRCLIGEWPRRTAEYENLFGVIPKEIPANMQDLEQMRILRNRVGHAFGRRPEKLDYPFATAPGEVERLSEDRFKRWLGIIERIAKSIDRHLGKAHIGEFETLWYFHRWRSQVRPKFERRFTEPRAFSRELRRLFGKTPGEEFCRQLIEYYNRQ